MYSPDMGRPNRAVQTVLGVAGGLKGMFDLTDMERVGRVGVQTAVAPYAAGSVADGHRAGWPVEWLAVEATLP